MDEEKQLINPYSSPELLGWSILCEVDTSGSCEFDKLVVWQTDSGAIVWGQDSGCSCPEPFENSDSGKEMEPVTKQNWNEFEKSFRSHCACAEDAYEKERLPSPAQVVADLIKIKKQVDASVMMQALRTRT